jgi:hypothetical protein
MVLTLFPARAPSMVLAEKMACALEMVLTWVMARSPTVVLT